MRALYVEDNIADAELVARALKRAIPPIELDVVVSVSEAIQQLSNQAGRYRWVLFDLGLPDGDGLEVLRYARQKKLPLAMIAVTGTGDETSVVKALKLGADDYIIKQKDYLEHLVSTLHRLDGHAQAVNTGKPLRVLYVEDNFDDGLLTKRALAVNAPHITLEVLAGDDSVITLLASNQFDVLLLDYRFNGIDALELTKRVHAHFENPVPIVIVTAVGSETIAAQALRLGVSDYLIKDSTYLHRLPITLEFAYTKHQLQTFAVRQELMRTRQQAAEEANREKSRFLASMSHEIRTPINGILGLIFLLRKTVLTPQQRDYVEKTEQSAQHLLDILSDTLDLSKIEAGAIQLEKADFRLDELLDRVEAVLIALTASKALNFSIETAPDLPLKLNGDALRLKQILLNLASNAIKFTDSGFVRIKVGAEQLSEKEIKLICSVKDSGIGLTQEQQKLLFNPYKQADSSISRRYGGSGLGLALCKEFITLMGGDIEINSEPDKGCEFRFNVKLNLAEDSRLRHKVEDRLNINAEESQLLQQARVLLVEDNPTNQLVTRAYLEHLQLTVDVCDNGRAAVDMIQSNTGHPYSLVLMDLQMPEMDGFAATRAIRALPGGDSIPIIAMTASVSLYDRKHSLSVGMNDFITKPIKLSALARLLVQWLRAEA